MKRIKLNFWKCFALTIAGLLGFLACEEIEVGNEFLSKPPELDYTKDSVFTSAKRAKELLWNTYATLPYGLPGSRYVNRSTFGSRGGVGATPIWPLTDLAGHATGWDGMGNWYQSGNYNAEAASIFDNWRMPDKYAFVARFGWEGIRDAYIFINNIDKVPDMSEAEKTRLKAEAKMIVAIHYVEMFRHYGGVIYIDHAYTVDEDTKVERLTVMQSVDTITALIDEAKKDLPFKVENPETWSGRLTSAAAMGVKVKFLLFAASPLFNSDQPYMEGRAADEHLVWTGGYNRSLWERARDAAEELINQIENSSYYGMVNTGNPHDDYVNGYYSRGTAGGNQETLLSTRQIHQNSGWIVENTLQSFPWRGIAVPLHNYVEMFPMQNGMDINASGSGYDPQNPYQNRDPRLSENVIYNGRDFQGRQAELWIGGRERTQRTDADAYTGYMMGKWVSDYQEYSNKIQHWPYVRIPEIYLSYAEILNHLNGGPTPEAFDYVNRVRDRVGVGTIETQIGKSQSQITQEEFREAVIRERALELGYEGVRWFDIIRYKKKEAFTSPDLGMDARIIQGEQTTGDYSDDVYEYEVVELDQHLFDWQSDFSPKYYLSAYPAVEVQKGYGLIQNPGWETSASNN